MNETARGSERIGVFLLDDHEMRDRARREDPLAGLTEQERRTQAAAYAARVFDEQHEAERDRPGH